MIFIQKKMCYFENSVNTFRIDKIKDHIKVKIHLTKKSSKKSSQLKHKTITTLKFKEVWDDFGFVFLKVCPLISPYIKLIKWSHSYWLDLPILAVCCLFIQLVLILQKKKILEKYEKLLESHARKVVLFQMPIVLGNFICPNCLSLCCPKNKLAN